MARQHLQVLAAEAMPRVDRVDLDHAEHAAFAADQRGAHHRMDVEVDDALAHVEAGVGGRVGRQHRLLARHHLVDDRAADADPLGDVLPAGAARLWAQARLVAGSSSTMNPRLAWRKIVNRLSSTLGSTSLSPRARPRFWPISKKRLELHLGVDRQPDPLLAGGDVQLRHERRTAAGVAVVVDHQRAGVARLFRRQAPAA